MGEAGAEDGYPVPERVFTLFNHRSGLDSNLNGILFAEQRQIEQALLHSAIHILYKHGIVTVLPVNGTAPCCRPNPLAVSLYVKVKAPGSISSNVGSILLVSISCFDRDSCGVCPECHGDSGGHPDLAVLGLGESLEPDCVNTGVRVRSIRENLAGQSQVRSLSEFVLYVFRSLCTNCQRKE